MRHPKVVLKKKMRRILEAVEFLLLHEDQGKTSYPAWKFNIA